MNIKAISFQTPTEESGTFNDTVVKSKSLTSGSETTSTTSSTVSSRPSLFDAEDLCPFDFAGLGFVGRTDQTNILLDAVNRISSKSKEAAPKDEGEGKKQSEVILIHGESGSGKSFLVRHVEQTIANRNFSNRDSNEIDESLLLSSSPPAFFASGKFAEPGQQQQGGQQVSARPYGAIVDALTELCYLVEDSNKELLSRIQASLQERLGDEIHGIVKLIPAVRLVADYSTRTAAEFQWSPAAGALIVRQLRLFLNAISSVHPVVLALDDIQWSDPASQGLLSSLLQDKLSTNLLLVGTVRSFEDPSSSPYQLPTAESYFPVTNITIDPLTLDQVNTIISKLIELHEDDTKSLAKVVLQKTRGNPHFVVSFVEMLYREKLLTKSPLTGRWTWEVKEVNAQTSVSTNVGQLLTSKIQSTGQGVQMVLMVASFLGDKFEGEILEEIVTSYLTVSEAFWAILPRPDGEVHSVEHGWVRKDVQKAIRIAVKVGLLEDLNAANLNNSKSFNNSKTFNASKTLDIGDPDEPSRFKFSHDQIRYASMALVPQDAIGERLRLMIGQGMLSYCQQEKAKASNETDLYLAAVDLVTANTPISPASNNDGNGDDQVVVLAKLCLDACQRAGGKSAFLSATKYADTGLRMIQQTGRECWNTHYDLALELATQASENHLFCGNLDVADEWALTAMHYGKSQMEKLRSTFVNVCVLASTGRLQDAKELCRKTLKGLGVAHRKKVKMWHVKGEAKKVLKLLNGRKAEDLYASPKTSDMAHILPRKIWLFMLFFNWRLGDATEVAYITLLFLQHILQHGVCNLSPSAFVFYGSFVSDFYGDYNEGYEFGKLAMHFVDNQDELEGKAFALKCCHYCTFHLKNPIFKSLEPSLEAFRLARDNGDIFLASFALQLHGMLSVCIGMPLGPYLKQLESYVQYCQEFQQLEVMYELLPYYQLALNFAGRYKDDPLKLTGEAMDEDVFVEKMTTWSEGPVPMLNFQYAQVVLCYVFDDFKHCEMNAKKKPASGLVPFMIKQLVWCMGALSAFQLARKKRARRHVWEARKLMKQLQAVAERGSPNSAHLLKLCQAEEAAFLDRKKTGDAIREFDTAVVMAARCGFRLVKAIALQRAGDYMIEVGDKERAFEYIQRSFEDYTDYGAFAKLKMMQTKYTGILREGFDVCKSPQGMTASKGLQAHVVDANVTMK